MKLLATRHATFKCRKRLVMLVHDEEDMIILRPEKWRLLLSPMKRIKRRKNRFMIVGIYCADVVADEKCLELISGSGRLEATWTNSVVSRYQGALSRSGKSGNKTTVKLFD